MKQKHFHLSFIIVILFTGLAAVISAEENTENKNITVISAQSNVDGSSEVRRERMAECIVSLPKASNLEAEVTAQSVFLKGINGDDSKNEWRKTYSANIEINYMLYQKDLIIVTTRSVQGQEPVMKEIEKHIKHSRRFESNPADGDLFAGRSKRQHYFSSADAAKKDAQRRAVIWLKQQAAVVCPEK